MAKAKNKTEKPEDQAPEVNLSESDEGQTKGADINVTEVLEQKDKNIADLQEMHEKAVSANKQLEAKLNSQTSSETQSLQAELLQSREKLANFDLIVRERDSYKDRLEKASEGILIPIEGKPHEIQAANWSQQPLSPCTVYKIDIDGSDEDASFLLLTQTNRPNSASGFFTYNGKTQFLDRCHIQKHDASNRIILERNVG